MCDICYKMWQLGWVAANDGNSVIHAHPPGATGFAVEHKAMDMYNMIEDVTVIGSAPLTPYGTPSTN